jgi:hypothetical protein
LRRLRNDEMEVASLSCSAVSLLVVQVRRSTAQSRASGAMMWVDRECVMVVSRRRDAAAAFAGSV